MVDRKLPMHPLQFGSATSEMAAAFFPQSISKVESVKCLPRECRLRRGRGSRTLTFRRFVQFETRGKAWRSTDRFSITGVADTQIGRRKRETVREQGDAFPAEIRVASAPRFDCESTAATNSHSILLSSSVSRFEPWGESAGRDLALSPSRSEENSI
jgi:hypothetical protein